MSDIKLEDALKNGDSADQQQVKPVKSETKTPARGKKGEGGLTKQAPTTKKPKPEVNDYNKLLGQFLGNKLYGVVKKELSADKLMKDADSAIKSLVKLLEGTAGKAVNKSGMTDDNKAGAKAFSNALGSYLQEKAVALLKTPEGKRFAAKVSKYTKTHPVVVLSLALAAAAVAVASNAKIPKLKGSQKLGAGFSLSEEAQLGKMRDIALNAAKLQLTYQKGLLKVNAGVEGNQKNGVTGQHANIRYGTKRTYIQTKADIDAKGVMTVGLGGGYGVTDKTTVTAGAAVKEKKIDNANAKIEHKGKKYDLAGALSYNAKNDRLRLDMGMKKGKTLDISAFYAKEQKNGKNAETYGGKAKFSVDDLKVALNGQFHTDTKIGSGSIKLNKGRMEAGGNVTYNGKLGKVTNYYIYFGFKDPKTFEEYLVSYKHDKYPDYSMDEFDLHLQHAIHGLVGTVDTDVKMKNGSMYSGAVSGRLAYKVDKDLSVFGGVAQGFGPEKQHGTMPFVGVKVKKVPVWVGYDTNSKGAMVGFSFKF